MSLRASISTGLWRNGSASDSRSEGWEFKSLWPHLANVIAAHAIAFPPNPVPASCHPLHSRRRTNRRAHCATSGNYSPPARCSLRSWRHARTLPWSAPAREMRQARSEGRVAEQALNRRRRAGLIQDFKEGLLYVRGALSDLPRPLPPPDLHELYVSADAPRCVRC